VHQVGHLPRVWIFSSFLGYSLMFLLVRVVYHCVVNEFERKESGHSLERLMETITCIHTHTHTHTHTHRRNVPDFGRGFLRSNYTDITQNTYIQSSVVTEILAREKCGLLWCLRTILCLWCNPLDLHCDNPAVACSSQRRPWLRNRCSECIVVGSQWTTMTRVSVFVVLFNGFMSLTSYFDVMYRY